MKGCQKHPIWDIAPHALCPDCLMEHVDMETWHGPLTPEEKRWSKMALEAALATMPSKAMKRHLLLIVLESGYEQAITETRCLQGEEESGRSWPPQFIPMYDNGTWL